MNNAAEVFVMDSGLAFFVGGAICPVNSADELNLSMSNQLSLGIPPHPGF